MTRFMMTLDDAVDLVIFAFQNAKNGDLFVQKAPAATLEVLAKSLSSILKSEVDIKIIGTRHGEKLYETLVTREEMAKSIDLDNYYRIPCDERDLNYENFFTDGAEKISNYEDYHSHNTSQLDIDGMKNLLLKLDIIQDEFNR
jgi:UDP-glucose 4-epimerase